MPADPRVYLGFYDLLAIYAAVATILVEVSCQLPLAALDEFGRLSRG